MDNFFALSEDELDVAGVGHVGVDLVSLAAFFEYFFCRRMRTYTTVSTVGTSATLGGLVDLDVLDDEVAGVKTLGVGVGLGVLQQSEQLLSGLDGPASLGDTELLACMPVRFLSFLHRVFFFSTVKQQFPRFFSSFDFRISLTIPPPRRHGELLVCPTVQKIESLTLCSATSGTSISAHGNGLLVIDDIVEVDESTLQFPSVDRLGSLAGVLEADAEVGAPSAGALCVGDCVCGVTDLFTMPSVLLTMLIMLIVGFAICKEFDWSCRS